MAVAAGRWGCGAPALLSTRNAIPGRSKRCCDMGGGSERPYRPAARVARAMQKKGSFTRKDPYILAEWTGLEPATPGVTGRHQNPHVYWLCGAFDISNFDRINHSFRVKKIAYFKLPDDYLISWVWAGNHPSPLPHVTSGSLRQGIADPLTGVPRQPLDLPVTRSLSTRLGIKVHRANRATTSCSDRLQPTAETASRNRPGATLGHQKMCGWDSVARLAGPSSACFVPSARTRQTFTHARILMPAFPVSLGKNAFSTLIPLALLQFSAISRVVTNTSHALLKG